MTLQSNGTPVLVSSGTGSATPSVTGTFPNGTPPAGHLIVAVISLYGNTAASSVSPPAGYATGPTVTATSCLCAIYTKAATGSDSAPTFTGAATAAANAQLTITIYDLSDPVTGNPPTIDQSGTGTGTTTLTAVTTAGNLASSGELAICMATIGQGTTGAGNTWGVSNAPPANWTLASASCQQTASAASQTANYYTTSSSVLTSGSTATVTIAKSRTTTHTAKLIVTFQSVITYGAPLGPLAQPAGLRVTWNRQGTAQASPIRLVAAAPPQPATYYPLNGPVSAGSAQQGGIRNGARLAARGRTYGRTGTYQGTGPAIYGAARSPAAAGSAADVAANSVSANNAARLPVRGRVLGIRYGGTRGQTGPPVYPLRRPSAARLQAPLRGRSAASRHAPAAAPLKFPPLTRPVQGRRQAQPQGYTNTIIAIPGPVAALAVFYPLNRPVSAALRPLPARGRVISRPGSFDRTGPAVRTPGQPAAARIRVLPPRGRSSGSRIAPAAAPVTLAPFRARTSPAAARSPFLPVHGRAATMAQLPSPAAPASATVYPLKRPAAARLPAPSRRGLVTRSAGTSGGTGPPFTLPRQPARARRPLPPRGRSASTPRGAVFVPPSVTVAAPLTRPVAAKLGPPRIRGFAATMVALPVPSIPNLTVAYPLARPVQARRPLPPPGRITRSPVTAHAPVSSPAAFYPLRQPPAARRSPDVVRGFAATMAALQVPSPPAPVYATYYPLGRPVKGQPAVPFRTGRSYSLPGTYQGTGPVFQPNSQPAGVLVVYQRAGSAPALSRFAPPAPFVPAVYYAPARPVSARRPLPRRGYATTTAKFPAPVPPPDRTEYYPLGRPVRGQPAVPFLKGRVYCRQGVRDQSGPVLTPLHRPAAATVRPLPRRPGYALSTPPFVPPFVPPGGHGYPYDARLTVTRWSAVAVDARDPSADEAGRWFAASGPA